MLEIGLQKAALISALVTERQMCLSCLAARATMSEISLESALRIIGAALAIYRYADTRCDLCGRRSTVVRIERPVDLPR
jgi:hypothetical protein